jgi:hypothetical protein
MALNLVVAAIVLLEHRLFEPRTPTATKREYCGSRRYRASSFAFGLGAYHHHLSPERSRQGLGNLPTTRRDAVDFLKAKIA